MDFFRCPLRSSLLATALLACFTASAVAASSDDTPRADTTGYIGLVGADMPKSAGSSDRRGVVLPIGAIVWQDRFFASVLDGVGVYAYRDAHWQLGTALTLDLSRRRASDSARTADLPGIPESVRADVFAKFDSDVAVASASLGQDVSGHRTGLLGQAKLAAKWSPDDRTTLAFGPGVTWGDARYMQTWFGVSPDQGVASGLPVHDARAGLSSVDLKLDAAYKIDARWRLDAAIERTRLVGDAADSPVIEQRLGTSWQLAVMRVF